MTDKSARMLFLSLLAALAFSLLGQSFSDTRAAPPHANGERLVYLAGELPPEKLVTLTAAIEAGPQPATLLLYSPKSLAALKTFLHGRPVGRVIPVGSFPGGIVELERKLDIAFGPPLAWHSDHPHDLWKRCFPKADCVVVCPAEPRGRLLQAACLAGAAKAPLFVTHGKPKEGDELRQWVDRWKPEKVYAIGAAQKLCDDLGDRKVVKLKEESAVAAAHLARLAHDGHTGTIVVANPTDNSMSLLAPWVALERRAALVLTSDKGDNVEDAVRSVMADRRLHEAEALILVGDLKALPMLRRPNPIPGDKDPYIEMEPFTPHGREPYTFAIGRLFHEELAVLPLMLARQRELAANGPRRALAASNAGAGLPLLEVFSRSTVKEFRNAGLETTALFGKDVNRDSLRKLMPENDIFLWEGHHNTLIRDYEFPAWDEPLRPSLVFLQSCLALMEAKVQPLFMRGAVGVVGSSSRIYSASGGAYSLAFFDALLYEGLSVGGSLRHAKNYLHAVALLKEKRLGKEATRTAANHRSAWAFTLWGDPTLKLPAPQRPDDALPPVQHEVHGSTVVVKLPSAMHDRVVTSKYKAQIPPNARLAGLIRKEKDTEGQVTEFLFAEVPLPKAQPGLVPQLHSRLPSSHWVFTWDARRRCGYLLVTPREKDRDEIRFHIDWTAGADEPAGTVAGQ